MGKSFFVSCKDSRIESNRSFYGSFSIGPFDSGQALTVANALRRTLLSELTGLAIVSVQIENVLHEYSTLPGVRDSILDILLNIKEIVLKKTVNPINNYIPKTIVSSYQQLGTTYFKPQVGYLKVKGPGVIRAKDLRLPPFIQCVDPEQYIATLTEDGSFTMKFLVMEGKNYVSQKPSTNLETTVLEKRENLLKEMYTMLNKRTANNLFSKEQGEASHKSLTNSMFKNSSILNIDAIFNPVTKVNYIIEVNENKMVEKASNYANIVEDLNNLIDLKTLKDTQNLVFEFFNSSSILKKKAPFHNLESFSKTYKQSKKQSVFLRDAASWHTRSASQVSTPTMNSMSPVPFRSVNIQKNVKSAKHFKQNSKITLSTINEHDFLDPLKNYKEKQNIILEIWTNGSLHPINALYSGFKHLILLFSNFNQLEILSSKNFVPMSKTNKAVKQIQKTGTSSYLKLISQMDQNTTTFENKELQKSPLAVNIGEANVAPKGMWTQSVFLTSSNTTNQIETLDIGSLSLSLRVYTLLKRMNIHTIGELVERSPNELLQNKNFGKRSLIEIEKSLEQMGYHLKRD